MDQEITLSDDFTWLRDVCMQEAHVSLPKEAEGNWTDQLPSMCVLCVCLFVLYVTRCCALFVVLCCLLPGCHVFVIRRSVIGPWGNETQNTGLEDVAAYQPDPLRQQPQRQSQRGDVEEVSEGG